MAKLTRRNPIGSGESQRPMREVLFGNEHLQVGTFRAAPDHPRFRDSGPARHHVFVFPHSAVWIKDASSVGFVADANIATLYNRGHLYRREPIDPRGDDSLWFAPSTSRLLDVLEEMALPHRENAPFSWRYRPVGPRHYALQVALAGYLRSEIRAEALVVEEVAITLLQHLLTSPDAVPAQDRSPRHRELTEHAKSILDSRFAEHLSLDDLALEVGCSTFHLCRVFRACAGLSIHAYRDQIRLREALHRLEHAESLSTLALDLGYDSHSHFTSRFRSAFGVAPSTFRAKSYRELRDFVR